ncbi:MAG TPA: hypothetical protein VI365_33565 [Trebonia sp.]
MAFLTRALETTPAEAIDERGGLGEIIRRVPEDAGSFSIGIKVRVPWWPSKEEFHASYEFELGPTRGGLGFEIIREQCSLPSRREARNFLNERGRVTIRRPGRDEAAISPPDRLFLQAGYKDFHRLYAGLSRPQFYNFDTETLRRPQPSATRPLLRHGGSALGDVIASLAAESPASKARIDAYLSAIVQDATAVEAHRAGGS